MLRLWLGRDIALDVLHLRAPPAFIHAVRFVAAVARDLVEAGLGEQQQRTARSLLQPEFDQGGRFFRVIDLGIDGIRVPGEREETFRLHFLDHRFPFDVFVPRVSDVTARDLARHEGALQFHAKPLAELAVIRQGAPDPRNRRLQLNALLDSVFHVVQPPGCRLAGPRGKCNLFVAFFPRLCAKKPLTRLATLATLSPEERAEIDHR
ncbi:hypothetical protein SBA2_30094 [Acidobacteriia bacterium SbA2]|nr:hypothetical protein SBA2_30094 [Acidobacteriia bacterium SbA2]